MVSWFRRSLPTVRGAVLAFNVLAAVFGAHVLNASSDLSPKHDFGTAPPGSIQNRGDYAYFVPLGRGAIQYLLVALTLTTALMLARGDEAAAGARPR